MSLSSNFLPRAPRFPRSPRSLRSKSVLGFIRNFRLGFLAYAYRSPLIARTLATEPTNTRN